MSGRPGEDELERIRAVHEDYAAGKIARPLAES